MVRIWNTEVGVERHSPHSHGSGEREEQVTVGRRLRHRRQGRPIGSLSLRRPQPSSLPLARRTRDLSPIRVTLPPPTLPLSSTCPLPPLFQAIFGESFARTQADKARKAKPRRSFPPPSLRISTRLGNLSTPFFLVAVFSIFNPSNFEGYKA